MSDQNNETPPETTPPPPPPTAPSVAALAKENAQLRAELASSAKAREEAAQQAKHFEALYSGVKTKARRQRVIGQIADQYSSPTAVSALADQAWVDLEAIERPDGATDADYEALQASKLHERLSSIEDGALLRAPATTTGGGRMIGPVIAPPSPPVRPL